MLLPAIHQNRHNAVGDITGDVHFLPNLGRQVLYVRTTGDDVHGDGSIDKPFRTLAGARRAIQPVLATGSSLVVDITGITELVTEPHGLTMPSVVSGDGYATHFDNPAIDFIEYPFTIYAKPATLLTVASGSIISQTANVTTGTYSVQVTGVTWPVNQWRGRFVRGATLGEIGVVVSNTSDTLETTSFFAFTNGFSIVDCGAEIRQADTGNYYPTISFNNMVSNMAIVGVRMTHANANYGTQALLLSDSKCFGVFCDIQGLSLFSGAEMLTISTLVRGESHIAGWLTMDRSAGLDFFPSYYPSVGGDSEYRYQWCIFDGCSSLGHGGDVEGVPPYEIFNCAIRNSVGQTNVTNHGVEYRGGGPCSVRNSVIDGAGGNAVNASGPGRLYLEGVHGSGSAGYGLLAGDGVSVQTASGTDMVGATGELKSGSRDATTWTGYRGGAKNEFDVSGTAATGSRIWE